MLQDAASDFEIEIVQREREIVHYPSRYEFLSAHNGIRKNTLHGLISNTGAGKSTLIKCIIAEAATATSILVWLSEETIPEYQEHISYLDKSCLGNIQFVYEKDIDNEIRDNQDAFLEYFEQMVDESGAEIVFIDNVTTSRFYSGFFGLYGQLKTADFLNSFVKRKCSLFYIGHTDKKIGDNYGQVVAPEDIRGSKELPNLTEYMYIMQKFTTENAQFNFVRVAKFRHHQKAKGWYILKYERNSYVGDGRVPFAVVNKVFKARDYFGKKSPKIDKKETSNGKKEVRQTAFL